MLEHTTGQTSAVCAPATGQRSASQILTKSLPLASVPFPNSSMTTKLFLVASFMMRETCWRSCMKVLWICRD